MMMLLILVATSIHAKGGARRDAFLAEVKRQDLSALYDTSGFFMDHDEFRDHPTLTQKPEFLGAIGEENRRFFIHFERVAKSDLDSLTYEISGKTRVKSSICRMTGTLKIRKATLHARDLESPARCLGEGELLGEYEFLEDSSCAHPGILKGTVSTSIYLNAAGKIRWNALIVGDSYTNNEFRGKWISSRTGKSKTCNWGHFGIPDRPELDCGDSEFIPCDAFLPLGWESYKIFISGDTASTPNKLKARSETARWWE